MSFIWQMELSLFELLLGNQKGSALKCGVFFCSVAAEQPYTEPGPAQGFFLLQAGFLACQTEHV